MDSTVGLQLLLAVSLACYQLGFLENFSLLFHRALIVLDL